MSTPTAPPAPLLFATFVRTESRRDRVLVELADGRTLRWNWHANGARLPHDLVHLVIESAFELADGYWGHIARGVNVPALAAAHEHDDPTTSPLAAEPGRTQLLQAEAAAALFAPSWTAAGQQPLPTPALLAAACARLGVAPPKAADEGALRRVATLLGRCTARWTAIEGEGGITLPFPLEAARASQPASGSPAGAPRTTPVGS